jgi:sugar/nucleoside kinase (ribokinase family)
MEYLRPMLRHADVFMPNDEEAHALTGERDAEAQANVFLSLGCGMVIITQGAKGTLVKNRETTLYADVYPIDFVDGSGSGDAFAAGFITGLTEGWGLKRTLEFASAIGASACTKLGCTSGVVNREGAEAMLRDYALHIEAYALT